MNRNDHPHLFRQSEVPVGFIEKLRSSGVVVTEDKDKIYACAHFDNTRDYNNFKDELAQLKKETA